MRYLFETGTALMLGSTLLSLPASLAASDQTPPEKNPPSECKVTCVDPHPACKESEKVIEVMQTLVKALNNRDWKTYMENLDDHCFIFDEATHQMISGKENVVAGMKSQSEKYAHEGIPFISVTIDQPYAKVSPDGLSACITFVAVRQFGGEHPFKEESHGTDVFVKRNGAWKKCHFRGTWKRV